MSVIYFLASLVLLAFGADMLVAGAARIARRIGIAPLVVGLTVVAFGTSAPELGVSLQSVFAGQGSIALGNVVGSNIFNVLFILGISAVVAPLAISAQLVRVDVPAVIFVSLLTLAMAWDGEYTRADGAVLFVGFVAYTLALLYLGRNQEAAGLPEGEDASTRFSWLANLARVAGGLVLLVIGARWLVASAVEFALRLGVDDQIVGLTIVAAGTSLPELVTSVVASIRGERDIAVGNVVGSNLFNLLCVLGLSATLAPTAIVVPPGMVMFDLPIMCAVAVVVLPMFFTGGTLARWEGGLLFGYYVAYTTYLVMAATGHTALEPFAAGMTYFVIPLTVLTLVVSTLNAWRRRWQTHGD